MVRLDTHGLKDLITPTCNSFRVNLAASYDGPARRRLPCVGMATSPSRPSSSTEKPCMMKPGLIVFETRLETLKHDMVAMTTCVVSSRRDVFDVIEAFSLVRH